MKAILAAVGLVLLALAGVVAAAAGGWRAVALLALMLLAMTAVAIVATVYREPAAPRAPRQEVGAPTDPALRALGRCVDAVSWAMHSARAADTSLRPVLRPIADTLFDARTGRGLKADPTAARRLLGEELSEFLDPTRTVRGQTDGSAPTEAALDRMLSHLEALTWR